MIFGLSVLNIVHRLPAIASGFPKLPSFPPDTVIIFATFSFSSDYVDIPSTVHFPFLSVLLCMLRCVWLWDTIDCSPPGSSVHEISQARILEWVAISSSRESYNPVSTCVSCTGRQILNHWTTWKRCCSVAQSCPTLWPHGLQCAKLLHPSPSAGVCANLCTLSQWCHPAISPSVVPFFSCFQSFPASGSLQMSWLFTSGGLRTGASTSASLLIKQFPLGSTGLISLLSKGLSRVFSKTTVWKHYFFGAQPFLLSSSHICTWLLEKIIALTIQTFVGKVMSLLFNMLSRLVIAFLPRSKCLLISWLQSPSTEILGPKKIKSVTMSTVSPSICHKVMGPDAMIFVFWMLSFKSAFSLSSFTFINRLFNSSSLSATRVVSSAYLRLLIFLPTILKQQNSCALSNQWYSILTRYL